jgi:DNA polymerase III delta prime subunit
MTLSFITKYQPIQLTDFEIEDELLSLIQTLIKMDNLNILFVGDSGTGKSSLISAIIKTYYGDTFNSNNILYINNLKDQGISYYRTDVKTFCQTTSCTIGKKKIIVLDDVDIINEQSQQVFRTCIDKYSNNVHFLSSCSNTQKVIDSLQSRMSIIKIKSLTNENLIKIFNKICKNENMMIDNPSRDLIISISNNSIRILINYLEKIKLLDEKVDSNIVSNICTNISFIEFEKYTNLCKLNQNRTEAIKLLYNIFDKGYSVMDILDNYFLFVKTTSIYTEKEKFEIIKLICKYITIFYNIHEDEIELALFTNNLIQLFS